MIVDTPPAVGLEQIEQAWHGIDHPEGLAIADDATIWCGGEAGQIFCGRLDGAPEQVATVPGRPLGFALDAAGNAYCATIAAPGLFRVTRDGSVDAVSRGAPGRPAAEPNYPAFLPSGALLFTDSGAWGEDDGCIFAVSPDGTTTVADTSCSRFPNGLCVVDDGGTLAVVESTLPGVVALTIGADGTLGERRILVEMPGTVPDGLALDVDGRLLVSCWAPDAVFALEPAGSLRLLAHDPLRYVLHEPTNIAFVPGTNRLVAANYGERFLSIFEHESLAAPIPRPAFPWTP